MKRLTRSRTNRSFLGVLGGLGDYFGVDPVLIRVVFIFAVLMTGLTPGLIAYVIAAMIIPEEGAPIIHEHAPYEQPPASEKHD